MGNSHFILGNAGQIGDALRRVLSDYNPEGWDLRYTGVPFDAPKKGFDFLHVCIPYDEHFEESVKAWQTGQYMSNDCITVVHSTVPVGTCEKLNAVHSPVRGVHPDLERGIRTFTKFFGGPRADEAAAQFSHLGIPTRHFPSSRDIEALKLWSTTYYGVVIAFEKLVHSYCEVNNLDFDTVYRLANDTYNKGFADLGRTDVTRPVLKHVPGRCGGHCVLPNFDLLTEGGSSAFLDAAKEILKGILG